MKISSASKKVLASALSAAMVVAFAPAAAFAAGVTDTTDTSKWTDEAWIAAGYTVKVSSVNADNKIETTYYEDLNDATLTGGAITLLADQELTAKKTFSGNASINLNGKSISLAKSAADEDTIYAVGDLTLSGTGSISNDRGGKTTVVANRALTVPATVTISAADDAGDDGEMGTADDVKGYGIWLNGSETKKVSIEGAAVTGGNGALAEATGSKAAVTVKSGTYEGVELHGNDDTVDGATFTDGLATDGVTVKGAVKVTKSADAKVKGTSSSKTAVKGVSGTATISKDASLDVEVTAAGAFASVTGVDGVAVAGQNAKVAVSATATGADSDATGIAALSGTTYKGASVSATAKATGNDSGADSHMTTTATAIAAAADLTVSDGAVAGAAVSADSAAYGFKGNVAFKVEKKGSAELSGSGYDNVHSFAADLSGTNDKSFTASAGKYTGKISKIAAEGITGGSYTQALTADVEYDADNYEVTDDGTYYTVAQYAGYELKGDAAAAMSGSKTVTELQDAKIFKAAQAALNAKSGAATLKIVEGKTLADLQAQTKKSDGEQLGLYYSVKDYNAKTATAEQTAAYDAITAYAKKANSVLSGTTKVQVSQLALGYIDSKTGEFVKMADVADLGTTTTGRETKANTVNLGNRTTEDTTFVAYDGKDVSALAYTKNSAGTYDANVTTLPAAYAELAISTKALADAIGNAGDNSGLQAQITALQDELATAKAKGATKTVKLAKKATKTKKAQTVALKAVKSASGAEGTFAKASGSSKVTVAADGTAKLKKGVKKGTYKATVTVTVGQSSNDVTVKFVVKK